MAENKASKGGGGKLNRTQTVTLRLDPKLRYLTELAARTQRRTTSGFIEWAIEQSLEHVVVSIGDDRRASLADENFRLWDVDEADRFAKLAIHYPNLLIHDEQAIWKLIRENGSFWKTGYQQKENNPYLLEDLINFKLIREYWETLKAVADGNASIEDLPKPPPNNSPEIIDDGFDDIPF